MNKSLMDALRRYMRNECSTREADEVEKWMLLNLTSSEADAIFEQLFAELPVEEDDLRKERTRERLNRFIDASLESQRQARRRMWQRGFRVLRYAAVVALGGLCLHLYQRLGETSTWHEVYASYGETERVVLPDSSIIWLHADSRLLYPERFGTRTRQIYVSGEIYADIARDPRHPFVVASNGSTLRVLGTEFNLRSYGDNDQIEVTLVEGSVALHVPTVKGTKSCRLTPGDVVRVDRGTGTLEQYRIDPSDYVSWKDRRALYFINRPLGEIVEELQRSFDVTISVRDRSLLETNYLATFVNGETLDEILAALNGDGSMEITREGDQYVIRAAAHE